MGGCQVSFAGRRIGYRWRCWKSTSRCGHSRIHRSMHTGSVSVATNLSYQKNMMTFAFGGGCHVTIGGNASDMRARSSSDEPQCACMASFASGSGEDSFPECLELEFAMITEINSITSSSDHDRFPPVVDILRPLPRVPWRSVDEPTVFGAVRCCMPVCSSIGFNLSVAELYGSLSDLRLRRTK